MSRKQLVPLDMNNNKIINLDTPTSGSDAATKAYVDANSGGSSTLNVRTENVDSQTVSFTDDIVYLDGISTIYVPHDTTGHVGKRITFTALNNQVNINEIINPSPLSTSTVTLYKQLDQVTLEAQTYNPSGNNWRAVERIEQVTERIYDYDSTIATLYVPYVGASSAVDLSGNVIDNVPSLTMKDGNITIQSSNTQTTLDTSGPDASLGAGNAYGNGDGGQAYLVAGSADYSTVGAVGDGGYIYMQVGAPGIAGGNRGYIHIDSPGAGGYTGSVDIHIDDLTAARALQMPDADGTLIAGTGVSSVTVGTTAPATPAIGDLWYDTN